MRFQTLNGSGFARAARREQCEQPRIDPEKSENSNLRRHGFLIIVISY